MNSKTIWSVIWSVLTCGQAARVKKSEKKRDDQVRLWLDMRDRTIEARSQLLLSLKRLSLTNKKAFWALKRSRWLLGSYASEHRETLAGDAGKDIIQSICDTEGALRSAAGALGSSAFGAAAGMSTWAAVSAFGTASTGTAISTLGGAAATNATLAWLGGGSLAVGGGGMALGTAVLGGIIILPAIAVNGFVQYRVATGKIRRLEWEIQEYKEATARLRALLEQYSAGHVRAGNLEFDTAAALDEFQFRYRQLLPWPILSRISCMIWRIFTGRSFNQTDNIRFEELVQAATRLVTASQKHVFDDNGIVVEETTSASVAQF